MCVYDMFSLLIDDIGAPPICDQRRDVCDELLLAINDVELRDDELLRFKASAIVFVPKGEVRHLSRGYRWYGGGGFLEPGAWLDAPLGLHPELKRPFRRNRLLCLGLLFSSLWPQLHGRAGNGAKAWTGMFESLVVCESPVARLVAYSGQASHSLHVRNVGTAKIDDVDSGGQVALTDGPRVGNLSASHLDERCVEPNAIAIGFNQEFGRGRPRRGTAKDNVDRNLSSSGMSAGLHVLWHWFCGATTSSFYARTKSPPARSLCKAPLGTEHRLGINGST